MVSVKQLEGDRSFLKRSTSSEQSKCQLAPLRGIKALLYSFGTSPAKGSAFGGFPCGSKEGQSLLDTLLLAQWEDRAWKGRLRYDVTTCETKVIDGEKRFIAQLNEKWDPYFITAIDNKVLQKSRSFKTKYFKTQEDILLCVASGKQESSEVIHLTMIPRDGALILITENPVEYGHVLLAPYDSHHLPHLFNKKSLELMAQTAAEVNTCSFRVFYDYAVATNAGHIYFQANYFADPLPVELLPTIPVCGNLFERGIQISEVVNYPVKALVFLTKAKLKLLVELVAEICSVLQDQDSAFNLLISDCGTKIFFFPQALVGRPLSAWECGGYFIFNTAPDFDHASEAEISQRMAFASLGDEDFQALKQLCCSIAAKLGILN